jgi:hypothetical protein
MCDYSLQGLPNRLAIEGEELVVHRFTTGAIGLASRKELEQTISSHNNGNRHTLWAAISAAIFPPHGQKAPAVCVPPGALLRVSDIAADLQHELGIGPEEIVTFTQTSLLRDTCHDAVRFSNSRQVLLQVFTEGQRVRVLSLACFETNDAESSKGTRLRMARSLAHRN